MASTRRIFLTVALAALGLATIGTGSAAAASSVGILNGVLYISGDAGANDVAVGLDPSDPADFRIADSSGISDPLPPTCVRISATAVRCPVSNAPNGIQVRLQEGDDQFKVSAGDIPVGTPLIVEGGAGNDTIRGSRRPAGDALYGDEGDDTIYGEGGNDTILGGEGNDELEGGPGNDKIDGEEGNDLIFGGGGDDELKGGAGRDLINGLFDDDAMFGGPGPDKLAGGSGNDKGIGGGGKDSFNGGAGTDRGSAEKEKSVEK